MRALRNLFISECIKLKRKKVLALIIAAIVIDVLIVSTTISSMAEPQFPLLYLRNFSTISALIHPLVISLIGIYIVSDEYKNNTINHLVTVPISPIKFVFGKMMILTALAFLLTIVTAVMFGACFIIFGDDSSTQLIGNILFHLLNNTITFSFSFLPIFLIIILSRSNIIVPIVSYIAYSGIVFFKGTGALMDEKYSLIRWIIDYLHPLGNSVMVNNELLYKFVPNPETYGIISPEVNWILSIICFIGMSLLSIGLSISVLKKQNY